MKIQSTSGTTSELHKTFLYAHHGWGKTYQCRHYQEEYGEGLIISGEAGLKSLSDMDIDYVEFQSWDGFRSIVTEIGKHGPGAMGYKWIGVDSITELSDRLLEHLEKEHEGSSNGFAMWGDYSRYMFGALKWLRDQPVHIYMTCLAGEEQDANGQINYWPLVKGSKVGKQIPALYDHVFCGVRATEGDANRPTIKRFVVTEEVRGWHGKSRDPLNLLDPVEETGNIVQLLNKIDGK